MACLAGNFQIRTSFDYAFISDEAYFEILCTCTIMEKYCECQGSFCRNFEFQEASQQVQFGSIFTNGGYIFRKNSKGIYYDGHERADVIEYRKKWANRMMGCKTKMARFSENDEVTMPQLSTDEKAMWLVEGENPIRKKGPGMSLMISEFKCACHGTMSNGAWSSREVFHPGADRDGYWTSAHMLKQLESNAIPLFEVIHPGCKAVFVFDQSTNHKAYSQNALIANKITLGDKEVEEDDLCTLRDTTFVRDGEEQVQSMYYEKDEWFTKKSGQWVTKKVKYVKGVRTILEERGMWLEKDPYNPTSQPDFMSQKTALHEAVEVSGHIFELYPKFHCECNWIERYWGSAKREVRLQCDYTYNSLDKNIHTFLDNAGKLSNVRNYYNRSWRYIEAYSQDMNVKEAHDSVKQIHFK
ncbi:hypothetical protein PHYBLDRAFT_185350 [Phycomyces blakesleeanus NRRL 1555(-)]|uniref:Uncharacterized protein n=1 Tax=Phycomyces blakesleeanus (strain ATCC 8743b / DSM 1359 / FGSC 10004 / NBRC 33097 / NRRL 1555) TaxID=763407 RepID=A0A167PYT7_PHYB8|nr:hypothetical protein PHYBLDRAFT_185350 [Phycomyces blakesleeanus NRRL 1555(-)]OAD78784.1 hypothetical protein PHYBLDRAFT_185350 [Phycomyces blakesleeanus NRRL 1555(-)]|eukprot:XP_018296824.1 hypothetical protein PHYBLDRAFT_185350 [Phycomyces blakesleeanus NRRL 1555(-)]